VRSNGGGGFGNLERDKIEVLVERADLERICSRGTKLRSGNNPVDGPAIKSGTSAAKGVVSKGDILSVKSPASIGDDFGRGTEAASSPSCTRLREPVAFKPGYI